MGIFKKPIYLYMSSVYILASICITYLMSMKTSFNRILLIHLQGSVLSTYLSVSLWRFSCWDKESCNSIKQTHKRKFWPAKGSPFCHRWTLFMFHHQKMTAKIRQIYMHFKPEGFVYQNLCSCWKFSFLRRTFFSYALLASKVGLC